MPLNQEWERRWREERVDQKKKWEEQEKRWEKNQKVINEISASIKAVERRIDFSIVALGAR